MFVGHCHIYRYSLVWDAAKEWVRVNHQTRVDSNLMSLRFR
jgi:hypothetical protein